MLRVLLVNPIPLSVQLSNLYLSAKDDFFVLMMTLVHLLVDTGVCVSVTDVSLTLTDQVERFSGWRWSSSFMESNFG